MSKNDMVSRWCQIAFLENRNGLKTLEIKEKQIHGTIQKRIYRIYGRQ